MEVLGSIAILVATFALAYLFGRSMPEETPPKRFEYKEPPQWQVTYYEPKDDEK